MVNYDGTFILDPSLSEDKLQVLLDRIKNIIAENKGVINKLEKWGKRELPYQINKFKEGYFLKIEFSLDPKQRASMDKSMRLVEEVMRYNVYKEEVKKSKETSPEKTESSK